MTRKKNIKNIFLLRVHIQKKLEILGDFSSFPYKKYNWQP